MTAGLENAVAAVLRSYPGGLQGIAQELGVSVSQVYVFAGLGHRREPWHWYRNLRRLRRWGDRRRPRSLEAWSKLWQAARNGQQREAVGDGVGEDR